MSAELLLAKLVRRGVKLMPAGSRLRFHPRSALTPEDRAQLAEHKPELLRLLSEAEDDGKRGTDADDDPDLANDWNWSAINDTDLAYLTGPRDYPPPCAWCGGRIVHNPLCDELRASWEVVMPHGKHRGQKLSTLSADYLLWLLGRSRVLPAELSDVVAAELKRRRNLNNGPLRI